MGKRFHKSAMSQNIALFPDNILHKILSNLDVIDAFRIRGTCKRFFHHYREKSIQPVPLAIDSMEEQVFFQCFIERLLHLPL
jgi:hypothetical protein